MTIDLKAEEDILITRTKFLKFTRITLDGKFRIGNYFRHCMITKSCRCRHDDDVSVLNEKWCRLHRFVRPTHQKYCSLSKTGVIQMNNENENTNEYHRVSNLMDFPMFHMNLPYGN